MTSGAAPGDGRGGLAREVLVGAARAAVAHSACIAGGPWLARTMIRRAAGGRNVLIVMYHLPTPALPESSLLRSLCISVETLSKQLQELARVRDVVSMDDACRHLARAGPERPGRDGAPDLAVVTFDDGYAGVHEHALPVLAALRMPALAYVATGYVGSSRRLLHDRLYASLTELFRRGVELADAGLPPHLEVALAGHAGLSIDATLDGLLAALPHDELAKLATTLEVRLGLDEEALPSDTRIATWEQLRELKASGVDIGGHTVNHVALATVSVERARAEIVGCRDDISVQLGCVPRHFSYPNCFYTRRVREEVARAGFVTATTGADAAKGRGVDLLALKRRALSEESTRGVAGYSAAIARCHFSEVFGALRLQRTVAFERPDRHDVAAADPVHSTP